MGKIADLEVGTLKVADNAVTQFFTSITDSGGFKSVQVNNPGLLPVLVWFGADGNFGCTRLSDGKSLAAFTGYFRKVAIDDTPIDATETYRVNTAGTLSGAMVSYK